MPNKMILFILKQWQRKQTFEVWPNLHSNSTNACAAIGKGMWKTLCHQRINYGWNLGYQTPLKKRKPEDFTADQPIAKIIWNNARELWTWKCFAYIFNCQRMYDDEPKSTTALTMKHSCSKTSRQTPSCSA